MNIKTGDKVVVIAGKDKGKEGRVTQIFKNTNKVIVENVNTVKRHQKSDGRNPGNIIEMDAPIHVSNVMILDPKTKKRTRVAHLLDKNNKKIRISCKSKESLD